MAAAAFLTPSAGTAAECRVHRRFGDSNGSGAVSTLEVAQVRSRLNARF